MIEREAVRAILLTPEQEVLLLRVQPPNGGNRFWITPGGGLEADETAETGLQRELWEEVGLTECVMGPLVWRRQHTFTWAGQRICQREQYYIVHVDRFAPRMTDAYESQFMDRFQWWPVLELVNIGEPLAPRSLAQIVMTYLLHGAPSAPLMLEVSVD